MSNVHVHLHVSSLDASRAFYERFLGAPPVKLRPGYAKFLTDLAPLNLALSSGSGDQGPTVSHLGLQVDSTRAVQDALARVRAAGLPVREEKGVDCCYANQDKFWVRDPDGVEWEVYHLNHDVEDEAPPAKDAAASCCSTDGGCAGSLA
jgi:catechol 2,3-dioxygenase-like lactoylglutathione lyase family enzyme